MYLLNEQTRNGTSTSSFVQSVFSVCKQSDLHTQQSNKNILQNISVNELMTAL